MKKYRYNIFFNKERIGTTQFEQADAPMGVVFGKINFDIDISDANSEYDFIKNFFIKNKIEYIDYQEDKIITTMNIPDLQIISEEGILMNKHEGISISGMAGEGFEITVLGLEQLNILFPNHSKAYHEKMKNITN